MSAPWLPPETGQWLSLTSLISVFAAMSVFVRIGKYRTLVTIVWGACAVFGAACLVATLVGAATGQPWYILVGLGVPGLVATLVYGVALSQLGRMYANVEQRRTFAKDL